MRQADMSKKKNIYIGIIKQNTSVVIMKENLITNIAASDGLVDSKLKKNVDLFL